MHPILARVQHLLEQAAKGESSISPELVEEFGEACKGAISRRFNDPKREFSIRMSGIGRPLCQQLAERDGMAKEPQNYQDTMKLFFGDLVEAAAIVVLKASGVPVEDTHGKVSLKRPLATVNGTYDIAIRDSEGVGIWDIKSASPYAFKHKFSRGYDGVCGGGDPFGYSTQGFGYSEAAGRPFRGWIAIDKSSGEWTVAEVPHDRADALREAALADIDGKLAILLDTNRAMEPLYTDMPEIFYRKETGNRVLAHTCEWCPFKWECWPSVAMLPSLPSKGFDKPIKFYTHVDDKWKAPSEHSES